MFRWEVKNMRSKDQMMDILSRAMKNIEADMAEALLETERLSLTRFAESRISDNIDNEATTLYLRIIKDKKIGVTATGDLTDEGIKQAVKNCSAFLPYMQPDEDFVSLPSMKDKIDKEDYIIKGTANFGPSERAGAIETISEVASKESCKASGAFRIEGSQLAVVNSLGMKRYFQGNQAQLSVTVSDKDDNSGWAIGFNRDASKIDYNALAEKALQKAISSQNPIALEDEQYTVILESAAVGQLLLLLAFMGFGCKTFYQKRSFMARSLGEKIAGDNFTVYESADDPDFNYRPFDYEGVKRKKVDIIRDGIAKGVVYNSYYANLMDTISTGHALPPNNGYGPYPKTMVVEPGNSSIPEMISSTERGVYITHFWYLNFLNPMRTMVTGTTIDGTYLIENGAISKPIKNMRTNQSILDAFSNIEMLTRDRIIYPQYSVLMKVPGMKINNFNLVQENDDGEDKC